LKREDFGSPPWSPGPVHRQPPNRVRPGREQHLGGSRRVPQVTWAPWWAPCRLASPSQLRPAPVPQKTGASLRRSRRIEARRACRCHDQEPAQGKPTRTATLAKEPAEAIEDRRRRRASAVDARPIGPLLVEQAIDRWQPAAVVEDGLGDLGRSRRPAHELGEHP